VQAFINRTVDFAASDSGMTDEDIAKVDGGAVLLPMTAGEIVLAYNLPGSPASGARELERSLLARLLG
jgi:phosphate transport system substrate-binding protein